MDTLKIDIGKRLEQIRLKLDLTQDEMGSMLGKGKGSISKYENGEASPGLHTLVKYAELGRTTINWIFTGEKSDYRNATCVSEAQETYTVSVPVRAMAGAGNPCCIDQLEPIGYIRLEPEYDGPNIQVVKIRGTSMEPSIVDGAHVGIDISDKEVISGQMYAVYMPHEGIVVKRIWIGPELVKIRSDNPQAPDHDMSIDRINWDTFIQGRVKWVLQKY